MGMRLSSREPLFYGNEAKLKQPLCCISLICSYMCTFPLKVHYKVIEILVVRWLGTRLKHIFKETTTSDKSRTVSWERSQYNLHYILLDSWEGLRMWLDSIPINYFVV